MITKVRKYVEQFHMLSQGDRVVVGVSGGADSMCLLSVLQTLKKEYNLSLFVVHVNHMMRGLAAEEDESYVVNYCKEHDIHVHVVREDVKELANKHGWSEEEAGRNVRYTAFSEECKLQNCHKIAVAHNKNDNAETVLFHLLRGSGIHGMSGIRPQRDNIIRPLLNITRTEIEEYLKEQQISFRIDATNLLEEYARNKIRLTMLPYAEREINAKATEHIVSMAEQLTEVAEFIDKETLKAHSETVSGNNNEIEIALDSFEKLDIAIQKSLIRKAIFLWRGQLKDIEEGHIMDVIALVKKQVGKYIQLPYGIIVKRAYTSIVFTTSENTTISGQGDFHELWAKNSNTMAQEVTLPCYAQIPGVYEINNGSYSYMVQFELLEYKNSMRIPKNGYTKWFDYDKIKTAIAVRTRQIGDYLQISKQGGRKSLKSVFIDNKIPSEMRDKIPLICDGDHVLWILEGRTSEGYLVDENTKTVLVVEAKKSMPV